MNYPGWIFIIIITLVNATQEKKNNLTETDKIGIGIDISFPSTQKTILRIWMNFAFVYSFTKYTLPSPEEIAGGEAIYKRNGGTQSPVLNPDFSIAGAFSQGQSISSIESVIDSWYKNGFLSKDELDVQKFVISSSAHFFDTIREHVIRTEDGAIIYGISGFLQTAKKGGVQGTVIAVFQKYYFSHEVVDEVSYARDTKDCIMWGQFCKTNFKFGSLDENDSNRLGHYLRSVAINQLGLNYSKAISTLTQQANNLIRFLPPTIRTAVEKVIDSDGKRPDQVLDKSHLSGDLLNL